MSTEIGIIITHCQGQQLRLLPTITTTCRPWREAISGVGVYLPWIRNGAGRSRVNI